MFGLRRYLLFVGMALVAESTAHAQVAAPSMTGHWTGSAQIAVNWTKARTLPVDIVIGADDRVTGKIGDATLVNGRFKSNRSWLTRALNWKTDYIVEGTLEGDIIAAEHIARESVKIPLDWIGDHFDGGVNTSGAVFAGAKSGVLAAARLILVRVQ